MRATKQWIWLITGLVFAFSLSMMAINGKFSTDNFYDQGEICEVVGFELELEGQNLQYAKEEDSYFTITDEFAAKDYVFYNNEWKYLLFQVSNLSVKELPLRLIFSDVNGVPVKEQEAVFQNGWNCISSEGTSFKSIRLEFSNCKGEHFRIRSAVARMELSKFTKKKMLFYGCIFFAVYLLLSKVLLALVQRWDRKTDILSMQWGMDFLLKIYERIYENFQQFPVIRWSKRKKQLLRIGIMLFLIFYSIVAVNVDHIKSWYSQSMCIYLLILILLSVLITESVKIKLQWNKKIGYLWGIFSILMCMSDFMVEKVYIGVGYAFLFAFGFFYYCWKQMKQPEKLLYEIGIALQISFAVLTLFCIFCRPYIAGSRYSGWYMNPNPFGRYQVTIFVVILTQIEHFIKTGQMTRKKIVLYGLEINLVFYFLWKSQCRTALIVFFVLILLYGIRLVKLKVSVLLFREYFKTVITVVLLFIPVKYAMNWLLSNIAFLLHTQVQWKEDAVYVLEAWILENPFVETVYASASRILTSVKRNSLDSISSGRITYWKAYLRNMNVWGHEFRCRVNGGGHSAHNLFLDIAYRYGMPTMGIFVVLWGTILKTIWQKLNLRNSYSFMAAGFIFSYFGMSCLDTLEQPWVYMAWILAYMSLGYYMFEKNCSEGETKCIERK